MQTNTVARSSSSTKIFLVFCGKVCSDLGSTFAGSHSTVNEILGDHNVDKQMTDNRGDVSGDHTSSKRLTNDRFRSPI